MTTTIGEEGDDAQFREQQYCDFETNGTMRDNNLGSRTGYFCQKLIPHQCNKYDNYYGWSFSLQAYLPYMRLAEIYLLYAEALAASGQNTAGGCALTAVDAINVLRNRVGCAEVADDQKSGNALMETIRRERACELAFEGFRWPAALVSARQGSLQPEAECRVLARYAQRNHYRQGCQRQHP